MITEVKKELMVFGRLARATCESLIAEVESLAIERDELKSGAEKLFDAIGLRGDDRCIAGVIGAHILNVNAIKLQRKSRMEAEGAMEEIDTLRADLTKVTAERDKWQANHEDMKRRNAFLLQRPDLDVTRIPVYEQMTADLAAEQSLRAAAEGEIAALRDANRVGNEHDDELIAAGKRLGRAEAEVEVERLKGEVSALYARLIADDHILKWENTEFAARLNQRGAKILELEEECKRLKG